MTTETPQTRESYTATYDYPGLLFPESRSRPVTDTTIPAAVDAQWDDKWYAVTIEKRVEKLFHAGDGDDAWVTQSNDKVGKYVVGTKVHVDDIPDEVDGQDTDILKSNIRGNSTDGYGVKTRLGNWQIAADYDGVVNPETMELEK